MQPVTGLRYGCSRRCQPQSAADPHQLAQVVADCVSRPVALGAVTVAQTELPGVLTDPHLAKGRLDDRLVSTTPFSTEALAPPRGR